MSEDPQFVNWTREMLDRFRVAYQKALESQADSFDFEEREYFVGYAKYLIEYLDSRL